MGVSRRAGSDPACARGGGGCTASSAGANMGTRVLLLGTCMAAWWLGAGETALFIAAAGVVVVVVLSTGSAGF